MDKQTAREGYQTATQNRFQAYYLDYLLNYQSIGSYAAAHGLTYETAKHRIAIGERVHLAHTETTHSDILAATGLAFF